jgi:hypothetical protein
MNSHDFLFRKSVLISFLQNSKKPLHCCQKRCNCSASCTVTEWFSLTRHDNLGFKASLPSQDAITEGIRMRCMSQKHDMNFIAREFAQCRIVLCEVLSSQKVTAKKFGTQMTARRCCAQGQEGSTTYKMTPERHSSLYRLAQCCLTSTRFSSLYGDRDDDV